MRIEMLITMANQIAGFFVSQRDDAEARTADHLKKFWDPRMRREIIAYVEAGGDGLAPAALAAVRLLTDKQCA